MIVFRRIYKSERGWWHCEVERDGVISYFSLRTKDEYIAAAKAEKYKRSLARIEQGRDD